jgi:hypothetical protein
MQFNEKEERRRISDLFDDYWCENQDIPFFDYLAWDLETTYDAPGTAWGKEFRVRVAFRNSTDHVDDNIDLYDLAFPHEYDLIKISSSVDLKNVRQRLEEFKANIITKVKKNPDSEAVLSGLKDFQRTTVEYVFDRLYTDEKDRFLIADEVGLGKTLIAKGVIAKAVAHLWGKKEDDGINDRRIDIVYVCSNNAIASQNINKLTMPSVTGNVEPTRITMLAHAIDHFDEKLNLIALTPGTSFEFGGTGMAQERALLFAILKRIWGIRSTSRNINFFRDAAGYETFEGWVQYYEDETGKKFNSEIMKSFEDHLIEHPDIKEEFDKISYFFSNDKGASDETRKRRRKVIRGLRHLLAKSSIAVLKPDVIILDEFQRFRDLIGDPDEEDIDDELQDRRELANDLFKCNKAKVILLSATPYKMYTMHEDVEGIDHYSELLETMNFLYKNDKKKAEKFKELLSNFRGCLRDSSKGIDNSRSAKIAIENELKEVMVRTERYRHIKDPDGLIDDGMPKRDIGELTPNDINSYVSLQKISDKLNVDYIMQYWKSAPYLFNFMDEYQSKRTFSESLKNPKKAYEALKDLSDEFLNMKKIADYDEIRICNTQMRTLLRQTIDNKDGDQWQLLWMPPAFPYWEPEGVFKNKNFTKTLIFSKLKVVPKAIGLIASYEFERKVFKGKGIHYHDEKRAAPPIVFDRKAGTDGEADKLTRMSNFTILYPSYELAKAVNPVEIAKSIKASGRQVTAAEMIKETAKIIKEKIMISVDIRSYNTDKSGRDDLRWYWALPRIIDRSNDNAYKCWRGDKPYLLEDDSKPESGILEEYINKLFDTSLEDLGKPPDDLWEMIAKIALGSPATVILRALLSIYKNSEQYVLEELLTSSSRIAMAFRTMVNQPEAVTILRSDLDNEESYWRNVIDYCVNGNFQSVIDEYVHVLIEVEGLVNLPPIRALRGVVDKISTAMALRTSTGDVDEYSIDHGAKEVKINGSNNGKKTKMRYNYCMPFGQQTDSPDKGNRDEKVRTAFNSPFRPFILASTSIGQEGLDFHLYCHSIFHWHLPSNPIDLEQREGRINRYKGHVIRKNISEGRDICTLDHKNNVWEQIFKENENEKGSGQCDMIPYWILEKGSNKMQRHVPALPMGEDLIKYRDIKNTLVSYRIAFGQPRQQDLLEYLNNNRDKVLDSNTIKDYLINLSPLAIEK